MMMVRLPFQIERFIHMSAPFYEPPPRGKTGCLNAVNGTASVF